MLRSCPRGERCGTKRLFINVVHNWALIHSEEAEAARTDLLRAQTILNEQLDIVEGRLRAAQVAFLLDRLLQEGKGSESSAGAFREKTQRASGVHSYTSRRELPDEGHSYAGTAVRGDIGVDRHDD